MNEEQIKAAQNFEAVMESAAFYHQKRFYAACMAMQPLLAKIDAGTEMAARRTIATISVAYADALLAALSPATSEGGK